MLLEDYLKQNKISYRKFAKSVGISPQYVCDLIKGRNQYISDNLAEKIQEKYPQIDLIEILTYKYMIRSDK